MINQDHTIKIILLGAPGSGKGTLAQKLVNHHFVQISTGDLFRKKLSEDTPEAHQIQKIINKGELIPDEITNNLAREAIIDALNKKQNIILDGYPRTIEQAKYLANVVKIDYVILLSVNEKVLFERITGRVSCKQCNRIYNEFTNPPKEKGICDNCHIALFKRRDDNQESFQIRMDEYKKKTAPLINFYKNNHDTQFIEVVQDANTSVNEIEQRIINIVEKK